VTFTFDRAATNFHYEGAAWREILRATPTVPKQPKPASVWKRYQI
jgi:hypothetical protein